MSRVRHITLIQLSTVVAAIVMAWADAAQAMQQGATALGNRYLAGGVSEAETAAMQEQRQMFSLWVITAARKTGAYLTDTKIRIIDSRQRVVFDSSIEGPWLLIDLPLGRYTVQASSNGQMIERATTIHPGDHHQAIFYFEAPADVMTEPPAPAAETSRKP